MVVAMRRERDGIHRRRSSHRSFVEDFDRIRLGDVVFPERLFQLLQWGSVPFSQHHQVDVATGDTVRDLDYTILYKETMEIRNTGGSKQVA